MLTKESTGSVPPARTLPQDAADRRDLLILAVLCGAAAAFFHLTLHATLELSDEGMIVYPGWLVARGALPYRDFAHVYGPSVFLLNGALFAAAGADLASVRWAVLLCKVMLAGLVYILARQVASRFAAIIAAALMVAIWGTPIWIFNVPYANHYALPLSMAALLTICMLPRWPRVRLVLAGLAIGLAATFKQTLGVFFAAAVGAWIIGSVDRAPVAGEPANRAWVWRHAVVAAVFLLLSIGTYLAYAAANVYSLSTLCLLAPAVAGAIVSAAAALASRRDPGVSRRNVGESLLFATAFAVPLIGYGVFFAGHGLLDAFIFNTVAGLPQQIDWFDPLPFPPQRSLLLTVAIAASLLALRGRLPGGPEGRHRRLTMASATVAVAAIGTVGWTPVATGLAAYFAGEWTRDIGYVVWWLPLLIVGFSFLPAFRSRKDGGDTLRLYWLFAAAAILQLYPAADLAHAVMILPGCLPLLAYGIDRVRGTAADPAARGRPVRSAFVALVALGVIGPCIQMVRTYRASRPATFAALERAPATWAIGNRYADAVALTRALRSATLDEHGGLFVLTNEQLLYFLTGIDSAFPREEFVFYLVEAELISAPEARALVDEQRVIDRLEGVRPLIVDHASNPAGRRLRQAFPLVADYLARRYREVNRVGDYILLRWTTS